jgi:hypothetical protein
MIDVCYVIGNGSKWGDNELRYSLRSVEKNLSGYRNVFIVGHKPLWVRGVTHVPYPDLHKTPDINILNKILRACRIEEMSDDFLFINDDHYLLKKFNAVKFPYFHKGDLDDSVLSRKSKDAYKKRLLNTYQALARKGFEYKNFDTHTPIVYNKKKFEKAVRMFDWSIPEGYVIKSIYANANGIDGVYEPDYKISCICGKTEMLKKIKVMSTTEAVCQEIQQFLNKTFPDKSKYEM